MGFILIQWNLMGSRFNVDSMVLLLLPLEL